ncbi:flagellar protein FlaJ [Halorientalis persicus]|jgi:flagellar protein FlaJ|uniref:Flagellar protein FlaJ n=1 Tax=Halorientalis persicus TaxID=1367881 RepID=A0A1H8DNT5_9EURY|nr:type II secretion system F family protein [Halorientalis persicus]SEN08484.1 flagellar protein FlaJ [Halorientalis persicus]
MTEEPQPSETGRFVPAARWLREFFRARRERHVDLRTDLNRARMPTTVDAYLARVATVSLSAVLIGALVGLGLAQVLGATVFAGFAVGPLGSVLVASLVVPPAIGAVFGLATWFGLYYAPRYRARQRRRKIDLLLPDVITYMFALSSGGMNTVEVLRRVSETEAIYGEAAREVDLVTREMEYFGADFLTALQRVADATPSDNLSEFLQDLLAIIDSGGNVTDFLDEVRGQYAREARMAQDRYLGTLSLFAEIYVVAMVAGPLFLLILLMVIGILGSPTGDGAMLIVYVVLPLGSLLAYLMLDVLNAPFTQGRRTLPRQSDAPETPDDPAVAEYEAEKRRQKFRDRLLNPIPELAANPMRSLIVSVPVAATLVVALVATGVVEPSVAAFYDAPTRTTGLLAVLPFVLVTLPVSMLYEARERELRYILDRFPDVLSSVASANRMGIPLSEAIDIVARRSTGRVGDELARVHNDVAWFADTRAALRRLAARARTRDVTRTLRLVVDADETSGDLDRVLSIAAETSRTHREFRRARTTEVLSYVAAAVVAFLVYLGIVLLIDDFYLQTVADVGQTITTSDPRLPATLSAINVTVFRLTLVHSAFVQAVCIGMIAGKMSQDSAYAGLKYSIALLTVSVAAFWVI